MNLTFYGLKDFPMVEPGDDLTGQIIDSLSVSDLVLQDDDIIVIAQKVVSKAEDRYLDLNSLTPSPEAIALAQEVDKPPAKVQAILNESVEVVRKRPGVLIVEHRLGFVQANAGIDQSNIEHAAEDPDSRCLLLPENPDASANAIREEIAGRLGIKVAVIINDSLGRAWRNGTLGLAIGVAGMAALESHIGGTDIFGRELLVTEVAVADELAAGASLVMGQTTEKTPVVVVRGYRPRVP
ncbi:MAG: coenzyme F420-0:L-glutamate ligase, partial [Gammaproteobacteria bacterium]|nr:coenzyme F420-0:L-glutamate ligase [Gammaproteobacteria bacterium]